MQPLSLFGSVLEALEKNFRPRNPIKVKYIKHATTFHVFISAHVSEIYLGRMAGHLLLDF